MTNASSTGFVNPRTRSWSREMTSVYEEISGIDIYAKLPELIEPGNRIGTVQREICDLRTQSGETTPVVAVGSHDTASAVAAIPATSQN
ncbi:FGGY family carbohydrate kinase, partial [Actinotignum urinale]|nr:rhamnulokinase [Actinotignum urinale]